MSHLDFEEDSELERYVKPAVSLFAKRDPQGVIDYFTPLLETGMSGRAFLTALDWVSIAHRELHRHSEAARYAVRALQVYDSFAVPDCVNKAVLYTRVAQSMLMVMALNDQSDLKFVIVNCKIADAMYRKLQRQGTRNAILNQYAWGLALQRQGLKEDAARIYQQGLDETGDGAGHEPQEMARWWLELGCLYMSELNMPNAGWQCYMRAHRFDPSNSCVLRNIGFACKALRQYDMAVTYLESAIALSSSKECEHGLEHARKREYCCEGKAGHVNPYDQHRMCSYCHLIAPNNDTILVCPCWRAWYCADGHCQLADWPKHELVCEYKTPFSFCLGLFVSDALEALLQQLDLVPKH